MTVALTLSTSLNADEPPDSDLGRLTVLFQPGNRGVNGLDLANPSVAPLGAATQGVCRVPGTICPKCGGPKTVRRGYCQDCNRAYARAWLDIPENLERHRLAEKARRATLTGEQRARIAACRAEYRLRNSEAIKKYGKSWYQAASQKPGAKEREAKKHAAYRSRPDIQEKTKARKAAYYARSEVKRRALLRRKAVYWTPSGGLRLRMSSAIRYSLKGAGKPAKWLDLVGYTVEELKAHIERQFAHGMSWENMPKWHIDHIVPLSSFRFEGADDPEFKAAWALTNLRPCWGSENLRKHARREFLL
jgi:hypothetical protein